MDAVKNLSIIVSSTRPQRVGAPVTAWVRQNLGPDWAVTILDLAEIDLPAFDHSWCLSVPTEAWGEIYPRVAEETTYAPSRLAQPCLAAAVIYALEGDETTLAGARRKALTLAFGRLAALRAAGVQAVVLE